MVNITISNPNDKIYGKLSNNYLYWMKIDQSSYPSVTNYIYSNMLMNIILKAELTTFLPVKDVYKKFLELLASERQSNMSIAIETAYKSKFNNSELSQKLLSTNDLQLLYMVNDTFLGIGPNRNGKNIIGRYLRQIRRQTQLNVKDQEKHKLQEQKDKELYDIYILYKALENKILYDKNDLSEYIGKTPEQIFDMLGGKTKVLETAPTPEDVRKLTQLNFMPKELYIAIHNPKILAEIVRKKDLETLQLYQIAKRKEIILEMYIDYLLAKNYPSLTPEQYPQARKQQLDKIGLQNLSELQTRIQKYYEEGMISERLSTNIDNQLLNIHVPLDSDVETAKLKIFTEKPSDKTQNITSKIDTNKPIEIDPYDNIFSPLDDSILIEINGLYYPSVIHYMMTFLLAQIPIIGNISDAYSMIIDPSLGPVKSKANFYHLNLIEQKYDKIFKEDFMSRLVTNMEIALNKKFENREFQNLLLITGNANLIWGEKDIILGSGTKETKGRNLVGKYLQKLRENIQNERKDEDIVSFTTENINDVLTNPLMNAWIQMKLGDICHVIYIVKNYTQIKMGENIKITKQFTESIMDQIYQPCSHIYSMVDDVKAEVPHNFRVMVQKCPGFSSIGYDIIEILWKRIVVILYYLVKYSKDASITDLRKILLTVENFVTKDSNCIQLLGTDKENCILSALINLLKNITEFNNLHGYTTEITNKEIDLATSIILGKDISDISTKVDKKPRKYYIGHGKKHFIEDDDEEEGEFELAQKEAKKIGDERALKWYKQNILGEKVDDDVDLVDEEEDDEEDKDEHDDKDKDVDVEINTPPSDNEGEEDEYWDDDPISEEDGYFSVRAENPRLIKIIQEILPDSTNINETIELLAKAVEKIMVYRIPERIKNNRINFFATQE